MAKKPRKRKLKGVTFPEMESYRSKPGVGDGLDSTSRRVGAQTILDVLASLNNPMRKRTPR